MFRPSPSGTTVPARSISRVLLPLLVTAWTVYAVPAVGTTLVFEEPPGAIDPTTGVYTQDGFIVYSRGGAPPFKLSYPAGNLVFRQGVGVPEINEVLVVREDFGLFDVSSIDIEANPGGGVNFSADGGQSVTVPSPDLGRILLEFSDISVLKIRPGDSGANLHEYDNIFLTATEPTPFPPATIDFTSGTLDGLGNYLEDGFTIDLEGTDFGRCPDSLCFRQGIGVPTPNEITMTRDDLNLFDVFTIDVRRNPGGLTFFGDADQVGLPANEIGRVQLGFSDIAVFKITSGGSGVQLHDLDNITTVPEPGTALLFVSGLVGLGLWGRRSVH